METIPCIIVDDEPIARAIIHTYCAHLPRLTIVASCSNALEAKAALESCQAAILFLDINMPVLSGIAFLKTLKQPPQIIFTTAYKEYAVEAFDLAACDYLLKPFSLERFIVAVDKAIERLQVSTVPGRLPAATNESLSFFVKADGKMYKIRCEDLLLAEARGNYTRLVTTQLTLLTMMTFSSLEALLPNGAFFRVHRSFIINVSKMTHIEGNRVFVGQYEVPIGTNYKEGFLKALGLNQKS